MASDLTNPFASDKKVIGFQFPFQTLWEQSGPKPGWGSSEPQFVSEGAPLPNGSVTKSPASFIRTPTPPQGTRGYVAPKVTSVPKDTSTSTTTTSAITPKTVATSIQKMGAQRAAEMASAKALGLEYVPGQALGTAEKQAKEQASLDRANQIAEEYAAVYSPLQELLAKQKTAASNRYADNQANIKSIFGALSTLSAQDAARIDKQFTTSIAKQQTDLATRVAEQRAAAGLGTEQAVATGAERGTGPAMNTNAIGVAAEQGIGQANAAQQNWEGLMGAQQTQAGLDIAARGTGYGQQELGALDALSRNFEDTMAQFDTQEVNIESQLAQAKLDRKNALEAGDAAAAQAAAELEAKLQIAADANATKRWVIQQQQAGANARSAASISAAANKTDKVTGIDKWFADTSAIKVNGGTVDPNAIITSVNAAATKVMRRNAAARTNPNTPISKPTQAEIINQWNVDFGGDAATPRAIEYIQKYSGYSK